MSTSTVAAAAQQHSKAPQQPARLRLGGRLLSAAETAVLLAGMQPHSQDCGSTGAPSPCGLSCSPACRGQAASSSEDERASEDTQAAVVTPNAWLHCATSGTGQQQLQQLQQLQQPSVFQLVLQPLPPWQGPALGAVPLAGGQTAVLVQPAAAACSPPPASWGALQAMPLQVATVSAKARKEALDGRAQQPPPDSARASRKRRAAPPNNLHAAAPASRAARTPGAGCGSAAAAAAAAAAATGARDAGRPPGAPSIASALLGEPGALANVDLATAARELHRMSDADLLRLASMVAGRGGSTVHGNDGARAVPAQPQVAQAQAACAAPGSASGGWSEAAPAPAPARVPQAGTAASTPVAPHATQQAAQQLQHSAWPQLLPALLHDDEGSLLDVSDLFAE